MRSIIKEGGSVKASGTEIGRLRDVAKPPAFGRKRFSRKGKPYLRTAQSPALTGSIRALGHSFRPKGKGAYGKLSECSPWCPDWKAPGTALFFDAPKNNQGFFYYGTLKI